MIAGIFGDPFSLRPTDIKLHYYQREAFDGVREEFLRGVMRTLVVMATGTGKTIVFGAIARSAVEKRKRVLVVVPWDSLVNQAIETLTDYGMEPALEKAESYARAFDDPAVVVASKQSMVGERLASWPKDYFDLIIDDESHHIVSSTGISLISHFSKARLVGFTATPERADGENLGDVFESIAYQYNMWKGMDDPQGPFLSKMTIVDIPTGVDLRNIKTTRKNDFSITELEEAIGPHVATLAKAIVAATGDRQTVIFTPDVGSATAFYSAMVGNAERGLKGLGVTADWISGDRPDGADVTKAFKKGNIQYVANCNKYTEGFDHEGIQAIALCHPTKSKSRLIQQIGRGTRIDRRPGSSKKNFLVLDFQWMMKDIRDRIRPVDLIYTGRYELKDGKIQEESCSEKTTKKRREVMDMADQIIKEKPGIELIQAIHAAKERIRERNKKSLPGIAEDEETKRGKAKGRQVLLVDAKPDEKQEFRMTTWEPVEYGATNTETVPTTKRLQEADRWQGTITEPQKKALMARTKGKMPDLDKLSKRRAGYLIGWLLERSNKGLATYPQMISLIKSGIPENVANKYTFEEADKRLEALFGSKKKRKA